MVGCSFMPEGKTWRDMFDMVIVQARKPSFWGADNLLYEIVTENGLMRQASKARKGGLFSGGSAKMVQKTLGLQGDSFLYVGDHIYTDAALAKLNFQYVPSFFTVLSTCSTNVPFMSMKISMRSSR